MLLQIILAAFVVFSVNNILQNTAACFKFITYNLRYFIIFILSTQSAHSKTQWTVLHYVPELSVVQMEQALYRLLQKCTSAWYYFKYIL